MIDTGNETIDLSPTGNILLNQHFIAECVFDTSKPGKTGHDGSPLPGTLMERGRDNLDEPTPERQAEQIILEAEQSRAHMYDIAGKNQSNLGQFLDLSKQSLIIDEDYQMIDAHIDDGLKQKIWDFEFIDLTRLLTKGKFAHEDQGQRLEIINNKEAIWLYAELFLGHHDGSCHGLW